MKLGLTILLALAFSAAASAQPLTPQPLTQAQIKAIVAAPDRSAADRTNDQRRHPEDILGFLAITPGMTALDLSAGGGYTTELLARSIGPTGKVYGQSRPRTGPPPTAPAAPEGNSHPSTTPPPPPPESAAPPRGKRPPPPAPRRCAAASASRRAARLAGRPRGPAEGHAG